MQFDISKSSDKNSWRPQLVALLRFAVPICIGQVAALGMGMTDVVVAGNYSKEDLAALMVGANTWQVVVFFFFGIGLANAPIIGRYFGRKDWQAIRSQLNQSIWLAITCGLLAALSVFLCATYIDLWNIDPEVVSVAQTYLYWVIPGAFALSVTPLFRASLESMNEIYFLMLLSVGAFLINIVIDIWFVFGGLGLPAMGGAGCGLATSLVLCTQLAILYWYTSRSKNLRERKLLRGFSLPKWPLIKPTLYLGLPIGLSLLMEIGFFAGMGLRMADIGVVEAGAHAIAISIASFVFIVFVSVGNAVTVKASQAIGRGEYSNARQIVFLGLASVGSLAALTSITTLGLSKWLPLLFNRDVDVVQLATKFLLFAALFQLVDGIQAIGISGLRAYKDTVTPSIIQFFAFWVVGLPIGFLLPGKTVFGYTVGSEGVWIAFCVSLCVSCTILMVRLYHIVFKHKTHEDELKAVQT